MQAGSNPQPYKLKGKELESNFDLNVDRVRRVEGDAEISGLSSTTLVSKRKTRIKEHSKWLNKDVVKMNRQPSVKKCSKWLPVHFIPIYRL